jgi:lysophospholipase L1-like esterase
VTIQSQSRLQLGRTVLLVAAAATVALLMAELAMRVAVGLGFFATLGDPTPPLDRKTGAGLYYVHPYSSYAMKPGYRNEHVTINSLGFRGGEIPQKKPPGEYRVVAIGGSTTFGIYQSDAWTYPLFMEKALRRDLGTDRVRVINTGLVSATTADNLHRLFTEILPLEPDMVVLYEAFNDVVPRVFNDFSMDYYHFRRVDPNQRSVLSRLLIYRLLLRAVFPAAFYENMNLVRYIWKFENLPDSDAEKIANFDRTSAAAFEQNMDQMIRIASANGIKVVLATFAIDKDKPNWMYYVPAELWPRGIADNNDAIRRLAERHGLPLIDFSTYALGDKTMFYDSIHMTDDGSRLQAEFFARTIGPIIADNLRASSTPRQ